MCYYGSILLVQINIINYSVKIELQRFRNFNPLEIFFFFNKNKIKYEFVLILIFLFNNLAENSIDGSILDKLTEDDLQNELKINSKIIRKKILTCII